MHNGSLLIDRRDGGCASSIATAHNADNAYDVVLRYLGLSYIHLRGKRLNDRAESSHVPVR
jgi:hypothetical protein